MSPRDPVDSSPRDAAGLRLLSAVLAALALAACNSGPRVTIVAPGGGTRAVVRVELADTPAARELGLMYRDHLDAGRGMMFVFPRPAPVRFWMRNTKIPLDMIFADAEGRVTTVAPNAQPYSTAPLGPADATQYVLEVNAGFAARHGIQPGDYFKFQGFSPRAAD